MDPLQQPQSPAGTPTISENPSQFAPTPESPTEAPGIPSEGNLSQEQMQSNLQELLAKLKGKAGSFDSQKTALDSQLETRRQETLQEIFDLFKAKGIDPNNPDEIQAFLDDLKQKNPVMYDLVVKTLNSVLGPEEESEQNMNINPNEAPQQNI